MEKFSLKADFVVKELFAHEKVRKQFLSDALGIPIDMIRAVRLANPFLRRRLWRQKQGILDIALVLNDDNKIDIEMQVHMQKHWVRRDLYYLARMYTDDLMIGENYGKLRRCISISLLDFKLFPNDTEYHHIYRLRDEMGKELTNLWEIHIVELGKTLTGDAVDDWIRLLNAKSQEEVDMLIIKNEGMREAVEVVREMGLIRTLRWIYDDYWKAKRDRWAEDEYVRDEGIAIGLERGKAEGKAEDILHLLENKNGKEVLSENLAEIIKTEKREEVLKKWLLSAARAESVEQFMEWEKLNRKEKHDRTVKVPNSEKS